MKKKREIKISIIIWNTASNNYYYGNNKDKNILKYKEQNNLANKDNYYKWRTGNYENNDLTRRAIRSNTNRNMNEDIHNYFIISKNEKEDNVDWE